MSHLKVGQAIVGYQSGRVVQRKIIEVGNPMGERETIFVDDISRIQEHVHQGAHMTYIYFRAGGADGYTISDASYDAVLGAISG